MMSGSYVLTDTIDNAFDAIFVDSYAGTDAVVTGKDPGFGFEGSPHAAADSEPTLERVRAVDGVEVATGSFWTSRPSCCAPTATDLHGRSTALRLRHRHGARVRAFNPLKLVEGRWPRGGGEVVSTKGSQTTRA